MAERSTIEWDKDDIDALGILKVDLLTLGMLICIRKALELIAVHHGRRYTLATVPPEEQSVWAMLSPADEVRRPAQNDPRITPPKRPRLGPAPGRFLPGSRDCH